MSTVKITSRPYPWRANVSGDDQDAIIHLQKRHGLGTPLADVSKVAVVRYAISEQARRDKGGLGKGPTWSERYARLDNQVRRRGKPPEKGRKAMRGIALVLTEQMETELAFIRAHHGFDHVQEALRFALRCQAESEGFKRFY